MAQGEFALAGKYLEKALSKIRTDDVTDSDVYAMLVDAAVQQRDGPSIERYASILEEGAADLDHKLYLAISHGAFGVLHRLKGEYEKAERRLLLAAEMFAGLDTRWQLGRTYLELGDLAGERDRTAEARQHYKESLSLFEEMGARPDVDRVRESMSQLEAPRSHQGKNTLPEDRS